MVKNAGSGESTGEPEVLAAAISDPAFGAVDRGEEVVVYNDLSREESEAHAKDFFAGKLTPGVNIRFTPHPVASKRA